RHKSWRKDVMEKMNVKRGATALDVCAGTGDWSFALATEIGPNGKVIGLDFSDNMLMIANQKIKNHPPMPQLEFVHGNAMDLPYEDNSFDYVTIGFGLRNVPDYSTVLKEDRKSTRLNSSHVSISYAVFCFKIKTKKMQEKC